MPCGWFVWSIWVYFSCRSLVTKYCFKEVIRVYYYFLRSTFRARLERRRIYEKYNNEVRKPGVRSRANI